MGVSTTKNIHDNASLSQIATKQQQPELDIEHMLTQLTLEEKISLTAGEHQPYRSVEFSTDMK